MRDLFKLKECMEDLVTSNEGCFMCFRLRKAKEYFMKAVCAPAVSQSGGLSYSLIRRFQPADAGSKSMLWVVRQLLRKPMTGWRWPKLPIS